MDLALLVYRNLHEALREIYGPCLIHVPSNHPTVTASPFNVKYALKIIDGLSTVYVRISANSIRVRHFGGGRAAIITFADPDYIAKTLHAAKTVKPTKRRRLR